MSQSFQQSSTLESGLSSSAPMPQNLPAPATRKPPARWLLRMQAIMWRFLMSIGMSIHRLAPPRPRHHAFTRRIPTTVSPKSGHFTLYFYTPRDYKIRSAREKSSPKHPVVINFHGGGFTIGRATDDARWANVVVDEMNAVCVGVDYRLAPENPFPSAVEDGADAILYLWKHADELHLDRDRFVVSGFSCGGNLAFTVPLRLHEELRSRNSERGASSKSAGPTNLARDTPDDPELSSSETGESADTTKATALPSKSPPSSSSGANRPGDNGDANDEDPVKDVDVQPRLAAVVSWYPATDFTLTRDERLKHLERKDQELWPAFTRLFDSCYITPQDLSRSNPYLSPSLASDNLLRDGLPDNIIVYTCEWDVLRYEAERLQERLQGIGKHVTHTMVERVAHAWDKQPSPLREAPGARQHYKDACTALELAFKGSEAL